MSVKTAKRGRMGQVKVKLLLTNFGDEEAARNGHIKKEAIRRAEVEALVDTGATRLVLPGRVARSLGLGRIARVWVRYANEERARRDLVGVVTLRLMGRVVTAEAIVEPEKDYALLGQIPLEALDLHVDSRGQRLLPNPDSPDAPLSEMQ